LRSFLAEKFVRRRLCVCVYICTYQVLYHVINSYSTVPLDKMAVAQLIINLCAICTTIVYITVLLVDPVSKEYLSKTPDNSEVICLTSYKVFTAALLKIQVLHYMTPC